MLFFCFPFPLLLSSFNCLLPEQFSLKPVRLGLSKIGVPMGEQGKSHGSPHGMAEYHWSEKSITAGELLSSGCRSPRSKRRASVRGQKGTPEQGVIAQLGRGGHLQGQRMVAVRTGFLQGICQISKYIQDKGARFLTAKVVKIIEREKIRMRCCLRIEDIGVNSWLSI